MFMDKVHPPAPLAVFIPPSNVVTNESHSPVWVTAVMSGTYIGGCQSHVFYAHKRKMNRCVLTWLRVEHHHTSQAHIHELTYKHTTHSKQFIAVERGNPCDTSSPAPLYSHLYPQYATPIKSQPALTHHPLKHPSDLPRTNIGQNTR